MEKGDYAIVIPEYLVNKCSCLGNQEDCPRDVAKCETHRLDGRVIVVVEVPSWDSSPDADIWFRPVEGTPAELTKDLCWSSDYFRKLSPLELLAREA